MQSIKEVNPNIWKNHSKYIFINDPINKKNPLEALYQESKLIIDRYSNLNAIYTDGSVNNDKTGIGIFNINFTKSIRLPDGTTIFDAEAYAILKAIDSALDSGVNSIIFTDSKSSVQAIFSGKTKNSIINNIINKIISAPIDIYISFIPGHTGILGNEFADSFARLATQLDVIEQIPPSFKHLKKLTLSSIMNKWQIELTDLDLELKFKPLIKLYKSSFRKNARRK